MKQPILFLLISILLLCPVVGCQQPDASSPPSTHQQAIVKYMSFEELITASTDVIKGKCLGCEEQENYVIYTFEVLERYAGEDTQEPIHVYVPFRAISVAESDISYPTTDITYQTEKSYYLILERTIDVYAEHDRYINVGGNIYLPAFNLEDSSLYGQTITTHSKAANLTNEKELLSHITSVLSQRPSTDTKQYWGTKYITSNDTNKIIAESTHVLKVQIDTDITGRSIEDRNVFVCTVLSSLKGDVTPNTAVSIVFPKNAVKIGDHYIVALYELPNNTPRHFVFSAKNSLFQVQQEELLKNLTKH